uniref:Uncharacterized protein n=1 Tax=Hyaloperonospora arabidopsidis (strain Emoy2) TaxID=559515 RepID=M4C4H6_HYAAE
MAKQDLLLRDRDDQLDDLINFLSGYRQWNPLMISGGGSSLCLISSRPQASAAVITPSQCHA